MNIFSLMIPPSVRLRTLSVLQSTNRICLLWQKLQWKIMS